MNIFNTSSGKIVSKEEIRPGVLYETDGYFLEQYNLNRELKPNTKLGQSIKEKGRVFIPILIDNDFRIADGQHRYHYAQKFGVSFSFIMLDLAEEDMRNMMIELNTTSKNWNINNYIDHYAAVGIDSYIKLKGLSTAFGMTKNLSTLSRLGEGRWSLSQNYTNSKYKNGLYSFYNYEALVIFLENMKTLSQESGLNMTGNRGSLFPLYSLHAYKNFDFNRLLKTSSKDDYKVLKIIKSITDDKDSAFRELVVAYNAGMSPENPKYIKIDPVVNIKTGKTTFNPVKSDLDPFFVKII